MDLGTVGRAVLTGLGFVCVAIGVIGLFIPLLPTTPFLILALALFARSSPRFMHWLEDHPYLGPPVRAWREQRAISRRVRLVALAVIWSSVITTGLLVLDRTLWRALAVALGIVLSLIVLRLPVAR